MGNSFIPTDYFPIVLQFIAAIGFVVVTMLATHYIGPKRKTADKLANFCEVLFGCHLVCIIRCRGHFYVPLGSQF
jgi:NADH:ubiquinone oxidoreductase subunit 3 (subunit A)